MQVIVAPDGIGGEKFTNRENGRHATLLASPRHFTKRYWHVFMGGHHLYDINRAGHNFSSRRGAVSFIEMLIK
jgi:hypothetical protein